MEEPSSGKMAQGSRLLSSLWRRDWFLLVLLVLLASGVRAWMIDHTAVAARDSIGFIRYAWQLEHQPWRTVLKSSLHPPLYPATVLAVSVPVRRLLHTSDCFAMQYSAQLASSLAGIVLVIPMFYLGKELFDRRVGFWSAALFQCLPVSSRALSDGLTEGLFLLLAATVFVLACRALRNGSVVRFGLCGLCGGLAYLTRPEGVLLVGTIGLVLLGQQMLPAWRKHWGRTLACAASLGLTALLVSAPYMTIIGGFTNKTTPNGILRAGAAEHGEEETPVDREMPSPSAAICYTANTPALAVVWGTWWPTWTESHHGGSLSWGLEAYIKEVGKGFHYLVWLPAFLGLWWFRERLRSAPGAWVMLLVCVLHSLLILRVAAVAGYLSERHSLLLVLCGSFWAAAGVQEIPRRLSAIGARLAYNPKIVTWGGHPRAVEVLLLVLMTVYGLPSTLKTMHPSRIGHREAGRWLADNTDPSDEVIDPFCWANYYAGRDFLSGTQPLPASGHVPMRYVVLDYGSHHSRIPLLRVAEKIAEGGKIVYHWPAQTMPGEALVRIFEVPR